MRRPVVVHPALPEEVAQAVYVRDRHAVVGHPEEVGRALRRPAGDLVAGGPSLAAFDHEVDRRIRGVDRALETHGTGARHLAAVAHQRRGLAHLIGSQEVEGAELVVRAPAAPVAERVEVAEHLGFGRYRRAGHGVSLRPVAPPSAGGSSVRAARPCCRGVPSSVRLAAYCIATPSPRSRSEADVCRSCDWDFSRRTAAATCRRSSTRAGQGSCAQSRASSSATTPAARC